MTETLLHAILAGMFGLLIGSFLNVCIYRMPRDLSVVRPRSFCPECEKPVAAYDNIPVLSWILLGGKCRNCKHPISWRYPVVELLTGAAFVVSVCILGWTGGALKLCIFLALQIALIFTDLEERILPDEFTIGGAVLGVVLSAFVISKPFILIAVLLQGWPNRAQSIAESLVGAAFVSIMLLAVAKAYEAIRGREGLGLGDVKMVAMIGAFLGLEATLVTLAMACAVGTVGGIAYVLITRKDMKTYELPLGTFLAIAAIAIAIRQTYLR